MTSDSTKPRGEYFTVQGEHIVLKNDGRWLSNGNEVTHQKTCRAFFKHVGFDEAKKQYYIHIGYERLYIEVEDTIYFVESFQNNKFLLSNENVYEIKECTLSYDETTQSLYVETPLKEKAKCLRQVHYFLLSHFNETTSSIQIEGSSYKVNLIK